MITLIAKICGIEDEKYLQIRMKINKKMNSKNIERKDIFPCIKV